MGRPEDIDDEVEEAVEAIARPLSTSLRRYMATTKANVRDRERTRATTLVTDAVHHYDGLALEATDIEDKTQLNAFAEHLRDLAEAIRGEG